MNFKAHIADLIRALTDAGMPQRHVAKRLGVQSANFISMIANRADTALLPVAHLPALQALCGFDDAEGFRLFQMRVKDAPSRPMMVDEPTLAWLQRCVAASCQPARSPLPEVVHAAR